MVDFRAILKPGKQLDVVEPETGAPVRWTVQSVLQEGGRGIVFEVTDETGRPAVLKGPSRAPGAVYSAIIEREILKKVSPHPNMVKYLGATDELGAPLVVVGWAHENPFLRLNTSPVRDRLQAWRDGDARGVGLPATTAIEIFFEVVLALEHLHSRGFVHSDVKPANVMVEVKPTSRNLDDAELFRAVADGRARGVLIDVGGARSESFLEDLNAGQVDPSIVPPELTPLYAPPEAIVGAETREGRRPIYSAGIDVYAAGLCLGVFLTGRAPYEHLQDRYDRNDLAQLLEIKTAERRGEVGPFPPDALRTAKHEDVNWGEGEQAAAGRAAFDDAVTAILARTLHPDQKERGTISQLRVYMERAFDLFPNPKARGGAVVAPTFRVRSRTLKLENRLIAAAGGAGDAAEQVLKLAADLGRGEGAPRAPTGRLAPKPEAPSEPAPPPQPPAPVPTPFGSGTYPVKEPGTRTLRVAPGQPIKAPSARFPAQPPPGTTRIPAQPPSAAPSAPPTSTTSKVTAEAAHDRVVLRVAPKDAGAVMQVLTAQNLRSLEVEGSRFEFRCPPARSSEILKLVLDQQVDVYFFERKKPVGLTTEGAPPRPEAGKAPPTTKPLGPRPGS